MTYKEAIEGIKDLLKQTQTANDCGLSNNDFAIEIDIYKTVLNLIQTQQVEIEKKDRQIDLMSEQLTTPLHSKEWVKEYFERKSENE